MNQCLYVLVDATTHGIYLNEFDGELPPMTELQLVNYFWLSGRHEIYSLQQAINDKINKVKGLAPETKNVLVYGCLDKKCPHCGYNLVKSDNKEYDYQCFYCDEDFYDCEVQK